MMQARAEMQYSFLRLLLSRWPRMCPAFLSSFWLSKYVLQRNADPPQTAPNQNQKQMREVGHEELRRLIETVERAIFDPTIDGS